MDEILNDLQQRRLLVKLIPEDAKDKIIIEYKKSQMQVDIDSKKTKITKLQAEVASLEAKK